MNSDPTDDYSSIGAPGTITFSSSNQPPVANAGPDQSARVGDVVTLNGSASDDNTPTQNLLYAWSLDVRPPGSSAALSNADTPTPSFVVDVAGTYQASLIVTDQDGAASNPDAVMISSRNLAPTADAGDDQLVFVGTTVTLDGSGSSDPENDPLSFSWVLSAPALNFATLSNADTASPSFVPDVPGDYQVTLDVSDPLGPGTPDTVLVTARTVQSFAEMHILAALNTVTGLARAEVTTKGNQIALTNFLVQALADLDAGDFTKAIDKLEKAQSRTDGCIAGGVPDSNGPGRDWITDCTAQSTVYMSLGDALDGLSP